MRESDAGDDPELTATLRAVFEVQVEHALEQARPGDARRWVCVLLGVFTGFVRGARHDRRTQPGIGREQCRPLTRVRILRRVRCRGTARWRFARLPLDGTGAQSRVARRAGAHGPVRTAAPGADDPALPGAGTSGDVPCNPHVHVTRYLDPSSIWPSFCPYHAAKGGIANVAARLGRVWPLIRTNRLADPGSAVLLRSMQGSDLRRVAPTPDVPRSADFSSHSVRPSNPAQVAGRRREQLLGRDPARRQTLIVMISSEGLEHVAVCVEPVAPVVLTHQRAGGLEIGSYPRKAVMTVPSRRCVAT